MIRKFEFPELKYIDENGCYAQICKIQEEFDELLKAYFNEPVDRFADEVADTIMASITLLLIIENRFGMKADEVIARLLKRLEERGYGRKTEGGQMP